MQKRPYALLFQAAYVRIHLDDEQKRILLLSCHLYLQQSRPVTITVPTSSIADKYSTSSARPSTTLRYGVSKKPKSFAFAYTESELINQCLDLQEFQLDKHDHSEFGVRHVLRSLHVHVLKPPGPSADTRRLCVISDTGLFWSITGDNWLEPKIFDCSSNWFCINQIFVETSYLFLLGLNASFNSTLNTN